MSKQARVLSVTLFLIGLPASSALAVTPEVSNPLTVSSEAMGTAREFTLVGGGGADAVNVTFTQNLVESNLVLVTFVNSSFAAGSYYICNGATQVGEFHFSVAGATQASAHVSGPPAGTVLNLTSDTCAAADQPLKFQINTVSSAVNSLTATISFELVTAALVPIDPPAGAGVPTATLATISPEYSATVANSNHVIDVVTSGAAGLQFSTATGSGAGGANGVPPLVLADSGDLGAFAAITIAGKTNDDASFGLVTSANVIVSGADFTGISRLFLAAGGTECDSTAGPGVAANLVQSALNPTSPTTLTVLAATFAAGTAVGTVTLRLCALVNGTTFLNPRVLLASVDINVTGAGALDPVPTTSSPAQTWDINGSEIRLTGVKGSPAGNETVISINNLGPHDATIRRLELFRLDQLVGPALAAPSCVVTDVPGATKTFFSNSGGTVNASTDIAGLCLGQAPFIATEAYGARLVLDMAPGNVGVQATRVFPDGRLLSVPVLKTPRVIPDVVPRAQFPLE